MDSFNNKQKIGPDLVKNFGLEEGGTYKFFYTDKPVRGTIIQYLGYDNLDGSAYGANRVGDMVRYLNKIGFNVISFKYPVKLNFEASAKQLAFLIPFIMQDPRISNFKIIMEGYSFGGFCLLNFLLNMPNEELQQLFQVVTHFRTQPLITGRGDFSFTKVFWHIDTLVPVLNVARIYSDSYDFVKVKVKARRARRRNNGRKSFMEIIREGPLDEQIDFSSFIEYFRLSKPQSQRIRSMFVEHSILESKIELLKTLNNQNSFLLLSSTRDFLMDKKSPSRNFLNLKSSGFKAKLLFIENIKKTSDKEKQLEKILKDLDPNISDKDWMVAYTNRSWDGHIGLNLESSFHELMNDIEENGHPTRDWLIDSNQ